MKVDVQFGDIAIKNIVGYKISVGLQPKSGFQGAFFIYVEQKLESFFNNLDAVSLGETAAPPRDTLSFSSDNMDYNFDNVDLKEVRTIITHRTKSRILEFKYDQNVTDSPDDPNPNIRVQNNETDKLEGVLKKYETSLGGGAEELFGFHLFQQPNVAPIFRFSHRRNKENSWLQKIIEANERRITGGGKFEAFEVTFGSEQLSIDENDVEGILVDESYGTMLDHSLANISEIGDKGIRNFTQFARLELFEDTPGQLVEKYNNKAFDAAALSGMTVETATVRFKARNYNQTQIV